MKRLLPLLLLAACSPGPDLGPRAPETGPAPALLPLDQLNARVAQATTGPQTAEALDARGAALRARAAAMQAQ